MADHPGYDIVNPDLYEDDCCSICLEPCLSAIVTPCNHYFCLKCLNDANTKTCPMCRTNINNNVKFPSGDKFNLFSTIHVRCRVCNTVTYRGYNGEQFQNHVERHCPVICDCGQAYVRSNKEAHMKECPLTEVPCQAFDLGCKFKCARRDISVHESSCVRVELAPLFRSLQEKVGLLPKIPTLSDFVGEYVMTSYRSYDDVHVSKLVISFDTNFNDFNGPLEGKQAYQDRKFKILSNFTIYDNQLLFTREDNIRYNAVLNQVTGMLTGAWIKSDKEFGSWYAMKIFP